VVDPIRRPTVPSRRLGAARRASRRDWRNAVYHASAVDRLATIEVVGTESEAEMLCSLLRSAEIRCMHRLTNQGAGAFDGMAVGGPHEVLVRLEDLESARKVLRAR
jgi:Putative prokaryotic signal transducing protein